MQPLRAARPVVILRHDLPDGSHHFDLLVARDPRGELPLHSFRVTVRPDLLGEGESCAAERLFDHRPLYLTYEGPISGDRGTVRRLRAGRAELLAEDEQQLELVVRWEDSTQTMRYRIRRDDRESADWRIVCLEFP